MEYTISAEKAYTHFITIQIKIETSSREKVTLQLPAWRPGRYELANYAKNIQTFNVWDENGKQLSYTKPGKDSWGIDTQKTNSIVVAYKYFAKQMDAGGSFVDEAICYLNFINCLLYEESTINEPCSLKLDINKEFSVACGIEPKDLYLKASSYYELADSPLIAAKNLQVYTYESHETTFKIWIHGNVAKSQEKLLNDFKRFTEKQLELFGEFPEKEYHFLLHILPYPHYHGVEHAKSTVITLGPASRFEEKDFYSNLVGISSHELFHAWNVCKIRPKELMPYNFQRETYFDTGYVAEGYTTYYGDLILARAGVYTVEEYFAELNILFKRHFENFGRQNKSLAESSIDLWLDGYVAGIPNRKVSIYVKGAIMALFADLWIRKSTDGAKSLDDVLKLMWENFGKKGLGYTSTDIKELIEKVSGQNAEFVFTKYIYGTADEESELNDLLKHCGCEIHKAANESDNERCFGFRVKEANEYATVELIVPKSPSAEHLVEGDAITQINDQPLNGTNFQELIKDQNKIKLLVNRNYRTQTITLMKGNSEWLPTYSITKKANATENERRNFKSWILQEF